VDRATVVAEVVRGGGWDVADAELVSVPNAQVGSRLNWR
jgi:hypothetical protein